VGFYGTAEAVPLLVVVGLEIGLELPYYPQRVRMSGSTRMV